MKFRTDLKTVGTLLEKQGIEYAYSYKKGNFDVVGFVMRILIVAGFLAAFIICFGKFAGVYVTLRTGGEIDKSARLSELLTIAYTFVIIIMTFGCVSQLNREIFAADDLKLFAAMPVSPRALYISKIITIYLQQLIFSAVAVAAVTASLAVHISGWVYYLVAVLFCLLLPLITIAIASIFALPFYIIKSFLKSRFVLNFIVITLLTAFLFTLYALVLNGVKEVLLGGNIRYLFNDKIIGAVSAVAAALYPARWIVNLMLGTRVTFSLLGIVGVLAVCFAISLLIIRKILTFALQSRVAGSRNFVHKKARMRPIGSPFFALVKKEFLHIFRTPSYMFSYFTIAVAMPLMVFFCMTIGDSLVYKLVGIECSFEMAIFLTLLFGSLTNFFCATNISRDGAMFYSVKALPVSYKSVIFSKVFLCMIVSAASQLVSAVLLAATDYLKWYAAIFLFFAGTVFSLVHVLIATRYDFDHARFSTEDDGEIKETGTTVSIIILVGMLISFAVGAATLVPRLALSIRGDYPDYLTYIAVSAAAIIFLAASYFYFSRKLGEKYYNFDGGGI